jgi:hypothetical protein
VAFRLLFLESRRRGRGRWLGRLNLGGDEAASRVVSTVHACLVVAHVLLAPQPLTGRAQGLAETLSLGYLLHDAQVVATREELRSRWVILHHLAFALALAGGGLRVDPEAGAVGLLAEGVVPFLNLGWAAHVSGYDKRGRGPELFASGNFLVTVVLYITTRLMVFPALVRRAWLGGSFGLAAGLGLLVALNYGWFLQFIWRAGAPPGSKA